jgi:hypothetical protein
MGAMIKTMGIFLSLYFCLGCLSDNEKVQYITIKDGKKLEPYAKVVYKVSADRQEVVYWIEAPGKDRSQLYRLKKCVVADLKNWEGEADYILLWKIKVEVVDGKFSPPGEALVNVDWFAWHFKTNPSPGFFSTMGRAVGYGIAILLILGIIGVILREVQKRVKKGKEKVAI